MEKLTLTPNRPCVIALAFTEGKPVPSKLGGDQIMYTLMDGRRFYADLEAAEKIDALSLGRGEPFEMTMCVDRTKKKSYEARYLANDAPPAQQTQAPVRQRVETPANGTTAQVTPQHPQDNAPVTNPSPSTSGGKLMACFFVAVESLCEVEAYAKRKGMNIQFTAEDVRCCANTLFIADSRGGR